ncbi:sodium-coupled monocarboxylate transporter 1-like [Frankliniella occidentalis]|uniref:Sodium-coupled monocarboxylate transporter 1-like n=1 Tax=Frankliniella occidentalis TaxID=133901 RepID=A0A9C6U8C9_FRAOC|nr:sodium-coupled monocarboxylate transporter 1-like [Frankliniella occidentalis]
MNTTTMASLAATLATSSTTASTPMLQEGNEPLFHWADYLVLALTLGISLLVGLYYGCFGSRQKTDLEYLLANRQMKTVPVAISLIAGFISGITLLGTPADIYSYGTQYYAIVIGIFFMAFAISYLYIPVFVNLNVRSSFEYLNVRFGDRAVRTLSAAIFLLDAHSTLSSTNINGLSTFYNKYRELHQ